MIIEKGLWEPHLSGIRCIACARKCIMADGQAGFCGVRANEKGRLDLLVYGKPAAVYVDPIEKKPFFHFLPGTKSFSLGTFGCNFACVFCQNWDLSQAPQHLRKKDPRRWKEYFLELLRDKVEDWPPEKIVETAISRDCDSISFTYNEPTIFTEYAVDVMKIARKKGLKGTYVTNGFETKETWDYIRDYIDAANIDLKAFTDSFYRKMTTAWIEPVKESIRYAKEIGIWVEVTTLLIPGENDSPEELKKAAEFLASIDPEMPWHITAFHPDYKLLNKPSTPPETLLRAREIGLSAGLKYVYVGNLPLAYSNYEDTICPSCGKVVVKRYGFILEENNIKDGKCKFCGYPIKGVWE